MVGSCFIYKLGMLTGQRFQAELSPSFLWKFTEFRAETPPMPLEFQTALPPHVFGIPVQETPPLPRNSKMPPVVWYGYFLESPNSSGLVDFAIGLVISVLNLPDGKMKFFGGIQITEL